VDSYSFEPQSPQLNHVKTEPSTSLYSISKHHLVAGNTVHYPTSTTFSTTLALKLPPRCLSSTLATGECPLLPGRVCLRGLDYRPELHRMLLDPSTDCVSYSPVYAVSDPQAVGCRTGVLGAPVLGSYIVPTRHRQIDHTNAFYSHSSVPWAARQPLFSPASVPHMELPSLVLESVPWVFSDLT
jgi:hypothetical protein